jgi:hypothetical protein
VTATGHPRSSGYDRAAGDFYCEPRWAIDALLDAEPFEGLIWDPACGSGNIPTACKDRGLRAFGTDIVQRGGASSVRDFLADNQITADNIISNPPFKLSQQFVLHALTRVRCKVVMLQHTTWLEGQGRHRALYKLGHLARVWHHCRRVSMPPGDVAVKAKGGSKAFSWFVFEPSHCSPHYSGGWLP